MLGEIPVLKLGPLLLTSIQGDLHDSRATDLQHTLLEMVRENDVEGVIVDVSSQEIVDSYVAGVLGETALMISIMNAKLVLVGLRPEVTMTIVEMGMDFKEMITAVDLEAGIAKLGFEIRKIKSSDEEDEAFFPDLGEENG